MTDINSDEHAPILPHVVYAGELRVHAVMLIWLGHQQLDAASFASTDEDVITEMLVAAMKRVQTDETSPPWVDHYEVHEQRPQNVGDKHGKSRPKMDIEFECHRRGIRPHLGFEAKRLRQSGGLRDYLGADGMAAFLSGYYPTTNGEAGMLGYVQDASVSEWSARLAYQIQQSSEKYQAANNGGWLEINDQPGMPWYTSQHTDAESKPLRVVHVLLPFH
jgi:hypothetical protein